MRCFAVIEEAQTVLGDRWLNDANIFVRWVKQGRKYGLGAILVTQQLGAIPDQIISPGDSFFVMHLLNDADLQTRKRHNVYHTDEILNYLHAKPIVSNCYFWSAPNRPFVLPVHVANFESVCRKTIPVRAGKSAVGRPTAVAQAVRDALDSNARVWLYPVRTFAGRQEKGWVAFSVDCLQAVVSQTVGGDSGKLEKDIFAVLARDKVRMGYAVLGGVTRRVWAIPQAELKLRSGKTLRPTAVDVADKF